MNIANGRDNKMFRNWYCQRKYNKMYDIEMRKEKVFVDELRLCEMMLRSMKIWRNKKK